MTLYQIDAFTNKLFGGNPAAVIPLQEWLTTEQMQQLAMENNLSETVFFVPPKDKSADYDFDIRWFTPAVEINLCGHATLASAYVLYNILGFNKPAIKFNSLSGILAITRSGNTFGMDFPAWKPQLFNDYPDELKQILGMPFMGVYKYRDILVELADEQMVRDCQPDFTLLKKTGYKMIITAKGGEVDFVSRFFAPSAGIDEDPVTGSAHSQLIPFWAEKLGKKSMHALQLSRRGGDIQCQFNGERVNIAGQCVFYMKGEICYP
jgi:PhzF family phenazine biosynthesis protein